MLEGKNSALKGFSCLALVLIGILSFIGTCLLPGIWWIIGLIDLILISGSGVLLYFYFDGKIKLNLLQ